MATLSQIRTKANAKLSTFWDALVIKQNAYYAKHGRYFCLIVTDPVVDGEDTTFVLKKKNGERHPLDVDFSFDSPLPFSVRVDHWSGGENAGFSATAEIELLDGRTFRRKRSSEGVTTDWTEFVNGEPTSLWQL
tara:strand:+ start:182 stop:583 length:402 start_codon:yes stop_codon:yes gene_type:complete